MSQTPIASIRPLNISLLQTCWTGDTQNLAALRLTSINWKVVKDVQILTLSRSQNFSEGLALMFFSRVPVCQHRYDKGDNHRPLS